VSQHQIRLKTVQTQDQTASMREACGPGFEELERRFEQLESGKEFISELLDGAGFYDAPKTLRRNRE